MFYFDLSGPFQFSISLYLSSAIACYFTNYRSDVSLKMSNGEASGIR